MPADAANSAAIQAMCDRGLAAHQAGRLAEAAALYQEVLAADPDHVQALHLLGVSCVQTGQLAAAVELIGRAVALRPDFAEAHGNLATAFNSLRRHDEALAAADRAIALQPGLPAAHGNRGQALQALGRPDEAVESYGRAAALNPTPQAHFNLAAVLREAGRLADALASYDRALAARPGYPEALRGRGVTLADLGRPDEALQSLDQALALNGAYAEGHFSRGVLLRDMGRPDQALASLDQAIALRLDYAEAHGNRGNALSDLRRHDEALAAYETATGLNPAYAEAWSNRTVPLRELRRPTEALAAAERALAVRPQYAEAHNNRGGALYDLRRLDEALASYNRAIGLKAGYAEAHANRGVVLFEMRRLDEAMAAFDEAIALKPHDAEAQHSQAMCRLARGDLAAGWTQYEWRWRTAQLASGLRDLGAPLWLGDEDLAGRTLLAHAEQGLGDTLQFCRYAPAIAARGGRVVLEAQPGLERLLARLEGVAEVVRRGEPLPAFDLQTPLMSLPLAVGDDLETPQEPYLSAEPAAVAAWATRLGAAEGLRVGLCWAGGARPELLVANSIDGRRSLPLAAFEPLADLTDVTFYSLQKGPPAEQLAEAVAGGWAGPPIVDLTGELADFADTAALVANLDLVIACDTAIAHLGGGLGKPVWILNRFDACWRWLDGRQDTPWYPTARLFRQAAPGDWTGVVGRVVDELRGLAAAAQRQ
jgi:tetratricopeptide (TPR) repeat protein